MRWGDLVIAGVILGLSTYAVARQFGSDPVERYELAAIRTLDVGEALPRDLVVRDIGHESRPIGEWFGPKATVLYSWSTTCPCVTICEPRMREVYVKYGKAVGVTWVGVAGEPTDTRDGVVALMTHLRAFYKMVLDPSHRLSKRLGFDRATMLVVLDGDGYVRWRGTQNDDLKNPTRNYLAEVLADVVEGRLPPTDLSMEIPPYGCAFSEPVECDDEGVPLSTPPPAPAPAGS
jgi:hypothetical protein